MTAVPFGLLFAEGYSTAESELVPYYDPDAQLSFCTDSEGRKVPFVEIGFHRLGATGTGTATKADFEGEDSDPEIPRPQPPNPRPGGPQTFTKVMNESSD